MIGFNNELSSEERDMSSSFIEALSSNNITFPPRGIVHDNFTRWGKNNRYWARAIEDGFVFGDYKEGFSNSWFPISDNKLSVSELKKRRLLLKIEREKLEKERLEGYLDTATQALLEYGDYSSNCSNSQYLKRKQINAFGTKFCPNHSYYKKPCLVIPAYDVDDKLWTLQYVFDEKCIGNGENKRDKTFFTGGKKQGNFYALGDVATALQIFVCEGFATAASVHIATGIVSIVAFDAGNIEHVIDALKLKYPDIEIVIAADDDRWKKQNTGRIAAEQAVLKHNVRFIPPVFKPELNEQKPTDFNDLHVLQGLDEVKKQLNLKPTGEMPIVFSELETPEIPENLLPDNLQVYATALAKTAEVKTAMVVASILGVLSAALCKKYVVSPKDGWNEPVNTYIFVALPPASNKSLILKNVTKPLIAWETEARKQKEPEIKKQLSKRKSQEKIIDGMRTKLSGIKDRHEQERAMNDIAELEANLTDIESLPKLYGNNCTPESLADDVKEQGGKFAIISDEGGVMETLAGLYSANNANIDIVLKGIDGGDMRIKRKLYEYELNPYLTFLLVVQPQILMNMNGKKAFTGNGMLERFLYFIPQSNLGYRTLETESLPQEYIDEYCYIITKLLNLPENEEPTKLTLSAQAYADWKAFHKATEKKFRAGGKLNSCVGWGGKISGFTLRLAGLIHVCETLGDDNQISGSAMYKALILAELLCEHAVAAFVGMGAEQSSHDAKDILKWLEELREPSFTKSDVLTAMKNKACGKAERLDKALMLLIERHYISAPKSRASTNSNKPTTYFEVNPELQKILQ